MDINRRLPPGEDWDEEQVVQRDNMLFRQIRAMRKSADEAASVEDFIDILDMAAILEAQNPDFNSQTRGAARYALTTMGKKVEEGKLKPLPLGTRDSVLYKQALDRIRGNFTKWGFNAKAFPEFKPRDFAEVAQLEPSKLPAEPKQSFTEKGSPYPFLLKEIVGEDEPARYDISRGATATKKAKAKAEVKAAASELGTKRPVREEAQPSASVKAWKSGRPLKRVRIASNQPGDASPPPPVRPGPLPPPATTPRAPR